MQGKVLGGGGLKLNVFAQASEPLKKDGIWIKTNSGQYSYNGVCLIEEEPDIYGRLTYYSTGYTSELSSGGFSNGAVASLGTDIYLIGSSTSSSTKINYKYNTTTNIYTQNAPLTTETKYISAVSVGTDIYILGNGLSNTYNYNRKYDTLTDTYTRKTDIPFEFSQGAATSIGTDIYIFGGTQNAKKAYKYDTLTDTYTQLTELPYSSSVYFNAVSYGTDIYLLGVGSTSSSAQKAVYKYDTLTDTYTQKQTSTYQFYRNFSVLVGTDIYTFSAANSFRYNILTNTYDDITHTPYAVSNGNGAVAIGNSVYIFGSSSYSRHACKYSAIRTLVDYIYIVSPQKGTKVKLTKNLEISVVKAYISNGTSFENYPCYYGDGTQWKLLS